MKNIYLIIIIFSLTACQTLGSIPERLGLTEEDPNAPVKLDLNYESNLELLWEKKAEKPLINFNFFEEKIESIKFFDLNASKIYNIKNRELELIDSDTGAVAELFELETNRIISGVSAGYNSFFYVDADGIFYAHDSTSGELKWTKALEDVVLSKILIKSTLVFVQTSSDILYGLDLQTGEIKWSKNIYR